MAPICARVVLDARQRHDTVDLFNTLGWVPYCIETDIRRCTIALRGAKRKEIGEENKSPLRKNLFFLPIFFFFFFFFFFLRATTDDLELENRDCS